MPATDNMLVSADGVVMDNPNKAQNEHTTAQLATSVIPEFWKYHSQRKVTVKCVLSLKASQETGSAAHLRPPLCLSAVLDKSGSMTGSKLSLVKATTEFITKQLLEKDMLGIVAFDSKVQEVVPMLHMSTDNRRVAESEICKIVAGSTTNLSGGLFKGLEHQQQAARKSSTDTKSTHESRLSSVFLLTDGQANAGVTDIDTITKIVRNMCDGSQVRINTFGFGTDHDHEFLQKLSEEGRGNYYYIESQEQVAGIFGEALGGLISTTCQNVDVVVKPLHGVKFNSEYTDYPTSTLPDGSLKISIGDVYAGENKDLFLEMEVDAIPDLVGMEMDQDLLSISIRYLDVVNCKLQDLTEKLQVKRLKDLSAEQLTADSKVKFHEARIKTSKVCFSPLSNFKF